MRTSGARNGEAGQSFFWRAWRASVNGLRVRIAVISDTHDRIPPGLIERLQPADEVWHLGDVCMPSVLEALVVRCPPLRVVMGNCDSELLWPLTLDLERGGARFHLVHIPPQAAPPGAQFVLHGHTHVPRDDTIRGVRWLNPGCISRANRGAPASFGWMEHKEGAWTWRIEWL
jgi:uncharacterized protein